MQCRSWQSGNDKYSLNQRAAFYPDKRSMRRVGRVLGKRGSAALRSVQVAWEMLTIKTN